MLVDVNPNAVDATNTNERKKKNVNILEKGQENCGSIEFQISINRTINVLWASLFVHKRRR